MSLLAVLTHKDLRQIFGFVLVIATLIAFNRGPSVNSVSVGEAKALMDAGALVIDVREPGTAAKAHVPGAKLIPLEALEANLPKLETFREQAVVVYCGGGAGRGPKATALLNQAGFSRAVNLDAGFEGWRKAGLPTKAG